MFTGIIEDIGTVKKTAQDQITIITLLNGMKTGDSISVNGVCLTVSKTLSFKQEMNIFSADISQETLVLTNLKYLKPGSKVNLERAMPAGGRFGGHIITGHVETTAKIISIKKLRNCHTFIFESKPVPVVNKGSVAIDGVSLTSIVQSARGGQALNPLRFSVALIPHTLKNTTLGMRKTGDIVNLESDVLAKYHKENRQKTESGITKETLKNAGFL